MCQVQRIVLAHDVVERAAAVRLLEELRGVEIGRGGEIIAGGMRSTKMACKTQTKMSGKRKTTF
jgi:hypothetical protein